MLRSIKYISFILFVLFFVGCSSSQKGTTPRNLEMIYNPSSSLLHPNFQVYNTSDSTSVLAGKILTKELLFNNVSSNDLLTSRIKIAYNLFNLEKKERITDSLTSFFSFEKDLNERYIYIEIPVKAKMGNKYILEIITIDQNRNSQYYSFLKVDRTANVTHQNFLIKDSTEIELNVNPEKFINSAFRISHYNTSVDSLNVFYFKKSKKTPFPANINDSISYNFTNPDSSWVCYLDSIPYKDYNLEGIYYFTKENKAINGIALKQFGKYFPKVITPNDLIEPLVYFNYEDTISYQDSIGKHTKLQVDNFWLSKVSNIERSRDLVKIFYKRVEYANQYFTSFVEGWQTDRGMIYIIYGLPDYIFKSDNEEKWIYAPVDLGPGISFTFSYYENTFSLNHYILKRDKIKDSGWDSTIRLWKNGEIIYYQK
ncbi:MAG: GWxTD domain-containing protein [Bacteroidales bacterium]|nr:GWxTD domain-containing protein [Bacteroidales bacterium]